MNIASLKNTTNMKNEKPPNTLQKYASYKSGYDFLATRMETINRGTNANAIIEYVTHIHQVMTSIKSLSSVRAAMSCVVIKPNRIIKFKSDSFCDPGKDTHQPFFFSYSTIIVASS